MHWGNLRLEHSDGHAFPAAKASEIYQRVIQRMLLAVVWWPGGGVSASKSSVLLGSSSFGFVTLCCYSFFFVLEGDVLHVVGFFLLLPTFHGFLSGPPDSVLSELEET